MKSHRVTKNVKEIEFEGVSGKRESKKKFPDTRNQKCLKVTLVFMLNSTQREKLTVYFSRVFF